MRYALLSYGDPGLVGALSVDERAGWEIDDIAFELAIRASGIVIGGLALDDSDTATTVRVLHGDPQLVDGPAVTSSDQLRCVLLIDVDHLDAALEVARRCPASRFSPLEVRPVRTWTPDG